jgi:hypothetical protein
VRSPAEYYVKYLLLMGLSHLRVNQVIEGLGFPRCKSGYLAETKDAMAPPRPFRPEASTGIVPRWLKRQQLWPAFHRDEYMDEATGILGNHDVRAIVEALTLAGCPDDQVVDLVTERTGVRLFPESVRYYRHFFWNRDMLSMEEWDEYLGEYSRGGKLRGLYDEGPGMAMWRLGHARQMDSSDMLKALQTEAFHRFMQSHTTGANDFNAAKVAEKWSGIFFESTKQISASEDKLSDVIARFEQICLRHNEGEVPSIELIAGALYSKRQVQEGSAMPVIDVGVDNATTRMQLPEAPETGEDTEE